MSDTELKIAKIEQRLDSLCRELNEDHEEARRNTDKIFTCLDELKKDSSKNMGFFGGIVFTVGAVFAVVVYLVGK